MGRKSKNKRAANGGHLHLQHVGGHYSMNSGFGQILQTRSAPFLKKEQVTLTDVLQVGSNANLGDDAQIIRMGPNGLQLFNAAGTAKPQSALWSQYGEMYEFYQVDGFSCRWIPNKFEFQVDSGNNQVVIAGPSFSCFDAEADFPQTPSAIMAYNTSKVASPYKDLANAVTNYKALAVQKQDKTILKTGDGVIGSEELYQDTSGFVTYVINPWRAGTANPQRYIGWMQFTITYTFSGLHRPGSSLNKLPIMPPPPIPLDGKDAQATSQEDSQANETQIQQQPQSDEGKVIVGAQGFTLTEQQYDLVRAMVKR